MANKGRKASSFTGLNDSIKFIDNLIKNYVGDINYFRNDFLKLGDYKKFKQVCDASWNEVLISLSKYKKESVPIGIHNKAFFEKFIDELSNSPQRFGLYLKTKITSILDENSDSYLETEIKESNRLIINDEFEFNKHFKFERKNNLRFNQIENHQENEGITKESFVILTLEKNFAKDALLYHLNNHLSKSLKSFIDENFEKEESENIFRQYKHLINSYQQWLINETGTNKSALGNSFKKIKDLIKEIIDLESNSADSSDNYVINLLKSEKVELNKYYDALNDTAYEGKSFPTFPGIIRTNDVKTPFSSNNEVKIDFNNFQFPIIGTGWSKEKIILVVLLELYNELNQIQIEENEDEASYLFELFDALNGFFRIIYIKPSDMSSNNIQKLQKLLFQTGGLQKVHELVLNSISQDSNYQILKFKQNIGKDSVQIDPKTDMIDKQNVLVINNNWKKSSKKEIDQDFKWDYPKINSLPDIILYLLTNSGIWAKEINIYVWDTDLYVHDKYWENSTNNDLFRWLKSTIDSIVLHFILSERKELARKINFVSLNKNEKLLILPVLNFNKNRSSTHTYYYDILDGLKSIDSILNDMLIDRESDQSYIYQHKINKEEMLSNIFNYVERTSNSKKTINIGSQVLVQHFNNLSLGKKDDFSDQFSKIEYIYNHSKDLDVLFKIMQSITGYGVELQRAYKDVSQNIFNNLVKFSTKKDNRSIIFPLLFFLFRISNLGGSKGDPLHSIFNHINEKTVNEFLSQKYMEVPLQKISGQLFKVPGSLGKILNTSLSLIGYAQPLDNEKIDFITISIESQTIRKYEDYNRDTVQRINITQFSNYQEPKILLNEYFLCDRNKNIDDYREFLDDLVLSVLIRLNKVSIISIKNSSGVGEFLSKKFDISASQGTWHRFNNLSVKMLEQISDNSKYNNLWGYVKDFAMIPLTAYQLSSDQDIYITDWDINTLFYEDSFDGRKIRQYKSNFQLISRPKRRKEHYLKEKFKDESNTNFYSNLDAILNIRPYNSQLTEDEKLNILDIIKTALLIGGESSKLGVIGLSRLFHNPYPDKFRIVFTPSFLIKGLDFFKLVE